MEARTSRRDTLDAPSSKGRHSVALTALTLGLLALTLGACSSDTNSDQGADGTTQGSEQAGATEEMFPDIVDVELDAQGGGQYQVSTTMSSPYDSPERYADAWRVLDPDENELGVRELGHDHASEQPFTRTTEVTIPDDVDQVTVQGRDQVSGWGGKTVTVDVPG